MQIIRFHAPEIPVINNVDVAEQKDVAESRDALVRQLYSPVRWVETVQALSAAGVRHVYECGPGKVRAGLIKRIDRSLPVTSLETAAAFELALTGKEENV